MQASDIAATTQGEATVLLDAERGRYHMLNAVGGRVWALLAHGTTRDAIVDALREEYAIPAETPDGQVDQDVGALLERLWLQRLVEEAS